MQISPTSSINIKALGEESVKWRDPKEMLGQEDFLQLLVTQFTNQDPLAPVADTEFIAQMAQFTALETSKEMSDEMSQMRLQNANQEAIGMIGKEVEILTGEDETMLGMVDKVMMDSNGPRISVGYQTFSLDKVLTVRGGNGTPTTLHTEDPEKRVQKNFGK